MKHLIASLFEKMGYSIRRSNLLFQELAQNEALERFSSILTLLAYYPETKKLPLVKAISLVQSSRSQLGQDVLALAVNGLGKGYFVEFGATDGYSLSNTFLLEKQFGWKGILCEPARLWHERLEANRDSLVDKRCVYSHSGKSISFSETTVGEFSTISNYVASDGHAPSRKSAYTYQVETVTLSELLAEHDAPLHIEFLSVDTEGSEYDILKGFNFGKYSFGLICVEHNFTTNRIKIKELLEQNSYAQIFPELSKWDDWYVKSET